MIFLTGSRDAPTLKHFAILATMRSAVRETLRTRMTTIFAVGRKFLPRPLPCSTFVEQGVRGPLA